METPLDPMMMVVDSDGFRTIMIISNLMNVMLQLGRRNGLVGL